MARVRWAAANAEMHEKPHNVLAGTPAYSRRAPQ
jgi:hypothetical protein